MRGSGGGSADVVDKLHGIASSLIFLFYGYVGIIGLTSSHMNVLGDFLLRISRPPAGDLRGGIWAHPVS